MKKFNYTMNHKADEAYMAANAEKAAVSEPDLGGRRGAGRRTGGFDFLISTKEGRIPMLKAISQVQKKIKVGTHGEDYGSWMSNPVFYVFGGGTLLAAVLAVLSFTTFHSTVLGVIFTVAVVGLLAGLGWITWIRR